VSARPTTIETIASSSGIKPRHQRAEDDQQDDQRSRQSESQLAVLQVLVRQGREVVIERELAGNCDVEPTSTVGNPHGVDDAVDVVLGIATERHRHPRGIAIPGHQPPLARVIERRHLRGARPAQLRSERSHPLLESRFVDRRPRGANDHHLGRALPQSASLRGRALRHQLDGAPRFRVARDFLVA
jgi:hypothetical protein